MQRKAVAWSVILVVFFVIGPLMIWLLYTTFDRAMMADLELDEVRNTEFGEEAEAFRKAAVTMSPEEAAGGWLALLDRYMEMSIFGPDGDVLVKALPPPSAWAELERQVGGLLGNGELNEAHRLGLRLLVHALSGDEEEQKKDLLALEQLAANDDEGVYSQWAHEMVLESLLSRSRDTNFIYRTIERRIAALSQSSEGRTLTLPALVPILGSEPARVLLTRALLLSGVELELGEDGPTLELARRLAVERIKDLKSAPWALAHSVEAVELYEALEKRFGKDGGEDQSGNSETARVYYMVGLVARQRTADAVKVARDLGRTEYSYAVNGTVNVLETMGRTGELCDFLHQLLEGSPELPYWRLYIQVAARASQTERMLELVRTVPRGGGSVDRRVLLERALLAHDRVEEGVEVLRDLVADPIVEMGDGGSMGAKCEQAVQIARIGLLLGRNDWIEEGVRSARATFDEQAAQSGSQGANLPGLVLSRLLVDLNRLPEAEAVLTRQLDLISGMDEESKLYWMDDTSRALLTERVAQLVRSGRHGEVIRLFDESPLWGVSDLAEVFEWDGYWRDEDQDSLEALAALAFRGAGRADVARSIVYQGLAGAGSDDGLFELLIEWEGRGAMEHLDRLFARDPFEERPLIWKAELLRRSGDLEQAEKIIRQAIAVDPSDGEQGPGRRMKAYAVLADIREARGDSAEAEVFRGAVRAVRLSEQADKYYAAGLLSRAVRMYGESLGHFEDAYCIQSRLALRMSELGRHEEAAAHYRKAYRLMPDSFGRMESHCFGCEHVFDGKKGQGIAETVFLEALKETPDKPQLHYLLGYLRKTQGRFAEALGHYQKAVQLDPDYLNAWSEIRVVGAAARLSSEEMDAALLNLLRLDPLRRHVYVDITHVTDLKALSEAVAAGEAMKPPVLESIYPLKASTREAVDLDSLDSLVEEELFGGGGRQTVGELMAEHAILRAAALMLEEAKDDLVAEFF